MSRLIDRAASPGGAARQMMDFDMDYDDGVEFGAGEPAVAQQFKGYLMKKSPNKMRVNRWQKRWSDTREARVAIRRRNRADCATKLR